MENWKVPPEKITLADQSIHIWYAGLTISAEQEKKYFNILNTEEKERANRFSMGENKKYFITARATLKFILSLYIDLPPSEIKFLYTTQGKPYLNNTIKFNLSHSDNIALYAVTKNDDIGIDIEKIKKRNVTGIINRFFSADEVKQLSQFNENSRELAFYRIWTQKEAIVKALGLGLSFSLKKFSMSSTQTAALLRSEDPRLNPADWRLKYIDINRFYAATVAMPQKMHDIQYYLFQIPFTL